MILQDKRAAFRRRSHLSEIRASLEVKDILTTVVWTMKYVSCQNVAVYVCGDLFLK